MAQHSGPQASELPSLLIHPQSLFLIVYPGGHCGEFLAWWLGMHPGSVRTQIRGIENNRYIWQPSYQYQYSEQGTRDRVFLTTHDREEPSKCGFRVTNPEQHIALYSSEKYRRFFYYLFLIKTVFFKYEVDPSKPPLFFTSENWKEFLKYLGTKQYFYYYEAEDWINNRPSNLKDLVTNKWHNVNTPGPLQFKYKFDIGDLFFGNTEQESLNLLSTLNISSSPRLFAYLTEYHQRNIELVEKYANMKVDEFLDLTIDQALDVMVNSCHQSFS